jgi:5-methylcytosine-specific restriction protein B
LKEYLRAVFAESELDSKLDEALNKFKETIK